MSKNYTLLKLLSKICCSQLSFKITQYKTTKNKKKAMKDYITTLFLKFYRFFFGFMKL